jgi:ankyrin repeat protein
MQDHNEDSPLSPRFCNEVVHRSAILSNDEGRMAGIDKELIEAARRENNLPEIRRLLSVGADVNVRDSSGNTPLHWASGHGNFPVVTELVEHGADIEAKDNGGDTPLHWASWNGRVAIVQALLSSGANIFAANNIGGLPIYYAVYMRNSEVAKCLLQQLYATSRRLPLHELLKDLTWIGDPRKNNAPPLRAALYRNVLGTDDVVEILEYLIDRNPDSLASCDQDGSLPLHLACRRGISFKIVQSLVKQYQASIKSVTPGGDLPLFLACEMSETSLDTIFFLMKQYQDLVIGGTVPTVGCQKYLGTDCIEIYEKCREWMTSIGHWWWRNFVVMSTEHWSGFVAANLRFYHMLRGNGQDVTGLG